MFRFCLFKIGQFLIHRLPLTLSYQVVQFISDVQFHCSRIDRKAITNNIRLIKKTQQDVSVDVRDVFRNFGRYLIEFFRMARFVDEKFIKNNVEVVNYEAITKVLNKGKGGIILTAHLGNWELGAAFLSHLGHPPLVVALPHKEKLVNDLFNAQREAIGAKVVQTDFGVRNGIKYLRNNKLIAVVGERAFGQSGEAIEFLGRKAKFPALPAMLSLRTNAPIIPSFVIRKGQNQFRLEFCEPIDPDKIDHTLDRKERLLILMKNYVQIIEKKICAYPSQWIMFREEWIS